jgi:hypothetical protein
VSRDVLEDGSLLMPDVKLRNIRVNQAMLRIDFVPEGKSRGILRWRLES